MTVSAFIDRLDLAGYYLCRIAAGFIWQSIVIVTVALCISVLARKRRASERYVMWMGAVSLMCVVAVIPFLVALVDSVRVNLPLVSRLVIPRLTVGFGADTGLLSGPGNTSDAVLAFISWIYAISAEMIATRFWAITVFLLCSVYFFIWYRVHRRYGCLRRILWQARILKSGRVIRVFERAAEDLSLERYYVVCEHDGVSAPFTVDEYHPGIRMVRAFMDIRTGRDLPVVIVPSRLVRSADDETIYRLALHELSHVRNYDAAVIRALTFFRRVFFFNPCAVLVTRFVVTLIEESADDDVIDVTGQPLDYARMLYRVAADSIGHPVLVSGSAALLLTKRSLLRRIKRILTVRSDRVKTSAWIRTVLTASAVAISLWCVYLYPAGHSWDRMTITGTASIDGHAYAGCPVYVRWNGSSNIRRIAVTDEAGVFSCIIPDSKISGRLLDPPRFFVLDSTAGRQPKSVPAFVVEHSSIFIPLNRSRLGYVR